MRTRTLSKTGNLEPTPRGFGASEVSDLPRQQHYSYSASVTTQSFNRNTKQTKPTLLLPVASPSDRTEFSVFTQPRRSHHYGVYISLLLHLIVVYIYLLLCSKICFHYVCVGLQCFGSLGALSLRHSSNINYVNYRIIKVRGRTVKNLCLNIILDNVLNY